MVSVTVSGYVKKNSEKFSISPERQTVSVNPVQLAAWTMTANVLLNLDETLTKE